MKLVIHEQLDLTDEQRVKIANILDEKITKRQAKRDELKSWIWMIGAQWEEATHLKWEYLFGSAEEIELDDLLGSSDDSDLELDDLL